MKIIPLSEGSFSVDKSKVFIPFDEQKDQLSDRPASLLVEVQPFLVITDDDVILIDAGLGFSTGDGTPQLHQVMMSKGINPSEVTKVLMSHLHKDHSGGIGIKDENGAATRLSFPNARHYIQRQELEYALSGSTSSYIEKDLKFLENESQVELLDGNGTLDGYIRYEMTAAHSKYHQVFRITDGSETAFFGGDDAPQLGQMKKRYIAKYDYDGKKCMELRQQWWQQGAKEGWTFLFYHDIKTPFINLKVES